jgi:lipopolysaccharide transport system permease protein
MQYKTNIVIEKIKPVKGLIAVNLIELWRHKELLYYFVWREIKVRYKQTLLGFIWAILQPLFMMIIFTLFFGKLAGVPSGDVPYPLFTYTALISWLFFAESVNRSGNSMVQEANIIKKIYFPRMILPLSGILSSLVDFAISFILLIGLMIFFNFSPTLQILWCIPLLILELLLAIGVGLWLSALNVEYRDIHYIIPFFLQLWLFASPVIYSSTYIPERFQTIYLLLNPMAGIIDGFRWAILNYGQLSSTLLISILTIIVILITGAFFFRYKEKSFADVV